jgi:hypothetical protein
MVYELDGHGSIPGIDKRFFRLYSVQTGLRGSPSLLSNEYLVPFFLGKVAEA